MSLSKYESTQETTNFARVARIILGPCTDVLRAVLAKEITPLNLIKHFNACISQNKKLSVSQEQEQLIYGGKYLEFDITLLYVLFRNVSSIPPHATKWGNNPNATDRSISANIERIRIKRNHYLHIKQPSISKSDFEQEWKQFFQIVKELEHYLGSSTDFQDAVTAIKECSMDPGVEQSYTQKLRIVENLQDLVNTLNEELKRMTNECAKKSWKEMHENEVSKWKEDEIVFLETHNFPIMLEQVKKQSFVTFVGVPGSGKTATVRHIALILQKEGYEILPIRDIRNMETFCNPKKPQVFVIDDVLGVFGLNVGEIDVIGKYKDLLENPLHAKTKTLMTCREVIYRKGRYFNCLLFKKEKTIMLHSDENALNDKDKFDLFEKYKLDKNMLSSVNLSSVSKMFPYLCKLFSKEKEFIRYGQEFFMCPLSCILRELNEMQFKNQIQYASLVLLMASGSILSENNLDNIDGANSKFNKMKCNFLRRCKVEPNTESFKIIDALSEMEETYTKKRGNEFTFIHNTMFEIIAYHFGLQFPGLILHYLNADYIAHYIKAESIGVNNKTSHGNQKHLDTNTTQESVVDLIIKLDEPYSAMFAERLFRDVENGELHVVFENEALKKTHVLAHYIKVMKRKSYQELHSIFLSPLKEKFKISRHELTESCVHDCSHFHIHMLLLNEKIVRRKYKIDVRAIRWVIYHGHYQILHAIIDNILKEKRQIHDLFQNSFNKTHRRYSVSESNADKSAVSDDAKAFNRKSEISFRYMMTATDTESEPVTEEQCRLLCLGCYSGDLNTVQILLKYVKRDAINNTVSSVFCNKEEVLWNIKPLVIACKLGYSEIVVALLKAGANVNLHDAFHTPLIAACENGHFVVVKELIEAGANVNKQNMHKTPLISACNMGHLRIVEELLKAGADVNFSDGNPIPLIAAIKKGHLRIAEVLIQAMFNVSLKNEGKTHLTTACWKNSFNVVKELVNAGIDVNQRDKYKTPLNIACFSGQLDIVKELIKAGANVNLKDLSHTPLIASCDKGHLSVVDELIKADANVNINYRYNTPLRAACYRGHLSVVRLLLKAGAVVNQRERDKTPLTTACYKGHLNVVKELINAGAYVNMHVICDKISVYSVGKNEHLSKNPHMVKALADIYLKRVFKTPLTAASYMGHMHVVQELIKAGADVNLKTPITAASYMGHLDIVEELLKAGADVNLSDENSTPLTASYKQGHLSIVEVLINAIFNVDLKAEGKTALTTACCKGSLSVVKELIKAGTDVNQRDRYKTPLNIACYNGQLNIVKELIKAGANVNLNDLSHTPLTASCDKGHLSVVEELIKAGANINVNYRYNTPLRAACYRGHSSVVRVLLKAGAVVNQKDREKTPLITACLKGHLCIVKELINAGVDVNLKGKKSPIKIALENDNWSIVKELQIAGAKDNGDY